jgi:hypothetical protein
MKKKRAKIEKRVYEILDAIDPSGHNSRIHKELYKSMSDKEFSEYMDGIKSGKYSVSIFAPNEHKEITIDVDRNFDILKKNYKEVFVKVTFTRDGIKYTPDIKFLVYNLPVRRMAQTIVKNFSVHKHTKQRSSLTGQVTRDSRSGELTLIETQILKSLTLKKSIQELLGDRGGDVAGSNAYKAHLFKYGKVSSKDLEKFREGRTSTKTVKAYFKAMHIDIDV